MNRRGFFGLLAGSAAAGAVIVPEAPKALGALTRVRPVCPKCGCELPMPSRTDIREQEYWGLSSTANPIMLPFRVDVPLPPSVEPFEVVCGQPACDWGGLARFWVEQV